jgi:hypothetical protein
MSTVSQMGIPGVGNGIFMPKLKNRWRVTFVNLGQGEGNSADVSMNAITCSRPNLSFEEVPIHRYNSVAYVAGKHTYEPLNLVLEDDVTNKVGQVIRSQFESQQKLIGADGPYLAAASTASTYKFGAKLEQLDGGELVLERWLIEGCWIQSMDLGEGDYSASEAHTITLTLRFDGARVEYENNQLGSAIGGVIN